MPICLERGGIRRFSLSVLVFFYLAANTSWLQAQEIAVLFTGSANGTIQNCLCPELPLGGLEKRAYFIEQYRHTHPDVLVIDNGDNFVDYLSPDVQSIITAAMDLIGYDAINLGDQDLVYGTPQYNKLTALVDAPGEVRVIEKGDLTFSILALLHPRTIRFYPEEIVKGLDLSDWEQQIADWLETDIPTGTFRILLSHSGFDTDREIAQKFSGIDLIVGGHSQTVLEEPAVVHGIPIVQAGGNAAYVGEARFNVTGKGFKLAYYKLHPMKLELPGHTQVLNLIDGMGGKHQPYTTGD